jgi:hypothetical protein
MRFIFCFFAVISVICLLILWLGVLSTTEVFNDEAQNSRYTVVAQYSSPDGTNQAVHITEMGGGAAGWCDQFVAVVPTSDFEKQIPIKKVNGDKIVFQARCSTKISATWEGVNTLLINYSDRNSPHSLPFTMLNKDKTQKISIRYLNDYQLGIN